MQQAALVLAGRAPDPRFKRGRDERTGREGDSSHNPRSQNLLRTNAALFPLPKDKGQGRSTPHHILKTFALYLGTFRLIAGLPPIREVDDTQALPDVFLPRP